MPNYNQFSNSLYVNNVSAQQCEKLEGFAEERMDCRYLVELLTRITSENKMTRQKSVNPKHPFQQN